MNWIKNNKGMTLVEIIVALALLGLVSVGIMGFFTDSFKFQARSQDTVLAQKQVESILEELRNANYSKIEDINQHINTFNSSSSDYNAVVNYEKISDTISNDKKTLALYKVTLTITDKNNTTITCFVDGTFSLERSISDYDKDVATDELVVVTFDPNNGECNKTTKNVIYNEKYGVLPTPTRKGYDFLGWYYNGEKILSETEVETQFNHSLIAQWQATQYWVEFNAGSAECSPRGYYVTYDSPYGELAYLVDSENYFLEGWYTSDGTKVTNTTIVSIAEDHVLTAQYNGKYTVEHYLENPNNSNYSLYKSDVKYVKAGSTVTLAEEKSTTDDLAYATYKEEASKVNGTTCTSVTLNANDNITVQLYYTRNKYTLTLNKGNYISTVSGANSYKWGQTVTAKATLSSPATGYKIIWEKWNSSNTSLLANQNDQQATFEMPKDSLILTANAKSSALSYTVSFNANGGTVSPTSKSVTYDSTYGTLPTPEKSGWTFNGWSTELNGGTVIISSDTVKITSDVTLYAKWKKDISLSYNLNGGSGTFATQSTTIYSPTTQYTFTINPNKPTPPTGHTFAGWSTDSSATTVNYNPGSTITLNDSKILYAVYKPITYTVKYNGNGNTSGSMASVTHTYDSPQKLTANAFKKTGYTFDGWATSSSGSVKYSDKQEVSNLSSTSGATINLYAVWSANTYTIAYNGNGATSGSMATSSHTYDSPKTLTANTFKKTGYTFTGWGKEQTTTVNYSDKQSVSNLTTTDGATINLYAIWKADCTHSSTTKSNYTCINSSEHSYTITCNNSLCSWTDTDEESHNSSSWCTQCSHSGSYRAPTCTQTGSQSCNICNKSRTLSTTGHDAPTESSTSGCTTYYSEKCNDCDYSYEWEETNHNMKTSTSSSGCDTTTTKTCSNCGYSTSSTSSNHKYNTTTDGCIVTTTCSKCGSYSSYAKHNYKTTTSGCTKTTTCSKCGDSSSVEEHNFSGANVCTRCGCNCNDRPWKDDNLIYCDCKTNKTYLGIVYTCPVHGELQCDGPGYCSKCKASI